MPENPARLSTKGRLFGSCYNRASKAVLAIMFGNRGLIFSMVIVGLVLVPNAHLALGSFISYSQLSFQIALIPISKRLYFIYDFHNFLETGLVKSRKEALPPQYRSM
jgi:hypothetical protein